MNRVVLSTRLILEAAERGRLTLGPAGVQLDGVLVDDDGGREVVELLDAGVLAEDGEQLTLHADFPPAALTPDEFLARWVVAR